MRLLVDTHSFLWFITGSEELSEGARQRIADTADNQPGRGFPCLSGPSALVRGGQDQAAG
jgi:hypothetical protein